MSILNAFDGAFEAILNPSHMVKPVDGFPQTLVVTFSGGILEALKRLAPCEVVAEMHAGVPIPVYKTVYREREIAFYLTWLGGPATVGLLEEALVMGAKQILLFGSCGSLDPAITDGHIIAPTHAYRDEGTSYHYVPADAGDYLEVPTAPRLLEILEELDVPHLPGKVWTTDAIYRETRGKMQARRRDGCVAVEMECASVMALAQFRGARIYQFLYTADSLSASGWEARLLGNMPPDLRDRLARLAFEVASRL